MAWWLQMEHDGERGKVMGGPTEWMGDSEARFAAAEAQVAEDLTKKYFTPDPGPRPWPESIYDPITGTAFYDPSHGTGPYSGFRQPTPDRPYQLRFTEKISYLPDCFGYMISSRVRDIIATLEPNVHQYLPVEFFYSDGREIEEERWYLNICNRLDTIAAAHSDIIVHPYTKKYLTGNGPFDVKIWKHKISGHAIWSEWKYNNNIYVSDRFADAFRDLGLHGWVFRKYLPEVE